nr:putative mitochondrial protein [Tanacetum cinerariifolium]
MSLSTESQAVPKELHKVVDQYDDVFAVPKELPPQRSYDHKIPLLEGTQPINIRLYRDPSIQKDAIEAMLNEFSKARVIKASNSPFASPIVMVKRKDNTWRMRVDYKKLNKNTTKDKSHIPIIKELIDELHGAVIFYKLELRSGYHQIQMCEEDIAKTTFKTHKGHYEFLVMDFGLTNAPSTFQALMNEVFKAFLRKFTLVFFDDILVYSQTIEEHKTHLQMVLETIRKHKLYAKLSKSMVEAPVLGLSDFNEPFVIETDASGVGLGLPKLRGKNFIMVIVDMLSKYAHFIGLSHPFNAAQIAQVFLESVYKLHRMPESIVSDKDKTEVVNMCLKGYLRCMTGDQLKKWIEWLSLVELWYNTNFHTFINTTPFEVVYGRAPPIHVPYLGGLSKVNAVDRILLAKEEAIQVLKFHLQRLQNRMKQQADKSRKIRDCLDSGLSLISSLVKLFFELIHGIMNFSGYQCQPMAQNIDFSGSDQIQTPQYPDVHPPSQETSNEVFQANHSIQNEESFENPSNEIAASNPNQEKEEPPQDSEIHQLIREECCVEASEEQKQSMKDTMLDALNSKLLLINSNSQRLEKEQQEVKNVIEQPAERGNRSIQSLQNFRVVHKSSISFKNTSQISSIHAIAPILSTKEPEHLLSMGYEHLSITPETESDQVTESKAENLVPIPSECEVTLEDKRKCDFPIFENSPVCNNHSDIFSDSKDDDDISVYDDFKDIEYVEASLFDPETVSVEEENVVHQAENDERLINLVKNDIPDDSSNDPLLEEANLFLESDNSIPPGIENIADDPEGDIRFLEKLLIDDSILSHESSDSNFEDNPSIPRPPLEPPDAETDTGEEIPVVMNDKDVINDENKDYHYFIFVIFDKVFSFLSAESEDTIFDPEVDLFLSDNSIPLGIENFGDDAEGDIHFQEELLIDDSILSHESPDSIFEDNPSVPL